MTAPTLGMPPSPDLPHGLPPADRAGPPKRAPARVTEQSAPSSCGRRDAASLAASPAPTQQRKRCGNDHGADGSARVRRAATVRALMTRTGQAPRLVLPAATSRSTSISRAQHGRGRAFAPGVQDVDAERESALRRSPGAKACYQQLRARNIGHQAALRQVANRLVGILHGCLKRRFATTSTPPGHTTQQPPLDSAKPGMSAADRIGEVESGKASHLGDSAMMRACLPPTSPAAAANEPTVLLSHAHLLRLGELADVQHAFTRGLRPRAATSPNGASDDCGCPGPRSGKRAAIWTALWRAGRDLAAMAGQVRGAPVAPATTSSRKPHRARPRHCLPSCRPNGLCPQARADSAGNGGSTWPAREPRGTVAGMTSGPARVRPSEPGVARTGDHRRRCPPGVRQPGRR
jgi:hypothetical protein